MRAVETGHLVFATLHSANASQTFGRILDLFPPDKHEQIRSSLSFNLKGIIAQKLVPALDKSIGRVPAVEIMFINPGIRKLVREGQYEKIPAVIETSGEEGMQIFNQSLVALEKDKLIDQETGLKHSPNPDQLKMQYKGIFLRKSGLIGS